MADTLYENIRNKVYTLESNENEFFEVALDVYNYQKKHNDVFAAYIRFLGKEDQSITSQEDFVFLPITHFKSHLIQTGHWEVQRIFESSGTSKINLSRHAVRDMDWYIDLAKANFENTFGNLSKVCVLGLLPGYLERPNSSLISMVEAFIKESLYSESGFYLDDFQALSDILISLQERSIPTVLFGVSFALLDFAEQYSMNYAGVQIIETGGMKGRRKELTRYELHERLKKAFGVEQIYSEYGMTELLSQAYYTSDYFRPGPTMRVLINEFNDPFRYQLGKNGQINIIDLANIDSCSFIQTGDIGRVLPDGRFSVLGRIEDADLRGCNLMYLS